MCGFIQGIVVSLETVFVNIDLTFELAMKESPSQQQSMKLNRVYKPCVYSVVVCRFR